MTEYAIETCIENGSQTVCEKSVVTADNCYSAWHEAKRVAESKGHNIVRVPECGDPPDDFPFRDSLSPDDIHTPDKP